jgi:2-polyprenyl-3-methyl-5-hydroxy-6-metoxy-1,4-benzoquinol methylase
MDGRQLYEEELKKEADFWGMMAEERWKGGIPLTMDFQKGTRYRVVRKALGWGDYIQDPTLEGLTPFGIARKRMIEYAKMAKGRNALDLCCGAGFLSLELARAGKRVDAIDCSEREINVAKKYHKTLKEKPSGSINWIIADLNNIELPKGKYDMVTAWDGLHHIVNIRELCRQIRDALKPGGIFLFSERVWGGKKQTFKTKICQGLETTLNVCLPLAYSHKKRREDFGKMIKTIYHDYLLRKKMTCKARGCDGEPVSPFENTTGREMLTAIEEEFRIEKMQYFGAFSEEACRSLNLPRILMFPGVLLLSWFDHFWVKTKVLDGKLMIGYARKKADSC